MTGSAIKYQYVNADIPLGNTIKSALTNPRVAFASTALIPEPTAVIGGVAHIQGRGVYNSGAVALGLTMTIQMANVTVATAAITLSVLGLVNMAWSIDANATILADGKVEVQGQATFSNSAVSTTVVNIPNTTSFTMPIAGGVPVTISAQWGTLALGGEVTLRQMIVQVT